MNFRFDFAGNFLSPVNISRRVHAANCSDEFFLDIPWFRYLANLHEYWIERLSSFTDFRPAPASGPANALSWLPALPL